LKRVGDAAAYVENSCASSGAVDNCSCDYCAGKTNYSGNTGYCGTTGTGNYTTGKTSYGGDVKPTKCSCKYSDNIYGNEVDLTKSYGGYSDDKNTTDYTDDSGNDYDLGLKYDSGYGGGDSIEDGLYKSDDYETTSVRQRPV